MTDNTENIFINSILKEALTLEHTASMQEEKAKQSELEKDYKTATIAYLQAGVLNNKASDCFRRAAKLYDQIDNEDKINSAELFQELAEKLEREGDTPNALTALKQAAEIYDQQKLKQKGNLCRLGIARYLTLLENYTEAAVMYELLAADCLFYDLDKSKAHSLFLNSGICRLANGDVAKIDRHLRKYQACDITFKLTPECKSLEKLKSAIVAQNIQEFTEAVVELNSIRELEIWQVTLLLRIKNTL